LESTDAIGEIIELNRAVVTGAANEARLEYARALDAVWATPCSDLNERCHHWVAHSLVEDSFVDCVIGPWDKEAQQRTIGRLDSPVTSSLAAIESDSIIVRRLSTALRAYGFAAMSDACCREKSRKALEILLDAHRRAMVAHEHSYHHSDSDSLIAARAALWQATDARDEILLEHVRSYLDQPRMLAEALRAINAAAEERQDAAAAARRLWPRVMEIVLDSGATNPALFTDRHWGVYVAELIPNPAYSWGYLTRELQDDPIAWRGLLAWASQVDRWVNVAAGRRQSIDALVMAVRELAPADQVAVGLDWIEGVVGEGGPACATTFTLPEWLHERRADLTTREQESRWQRIVDLLVVAGDHRVADLAD
jgi:hypothetical protein